MADIVRVSTTELKNASGVFATANQNIKTITENVVGIADELTAVWTGEASVAYCNKLRGLRNSMTQIQTKVNNQAQSLTDMATVFEEAERQNVEQSNELKNDDFV